MQVSTLQARGPAAGCPASAWSKGRLPRAPGGGVVPCRSAVTPGGDSNTPPARASSSFMAHGAGQGVPHTPGLVSQTDSWRLLRAHADEPGEVPHLRQLMADTKRCEKMFASHDGITLDYSRQVRV